MNKHVKSIISAAMALAMCLSMAGCGSGELSEKDLEKRLERLDGMSAEDAEKEIEKAFGENNDSSDSDDSEAAAAAEYLAENLYIGSVGYLTRLAISGEPVPDFNEIKYELLAEKSGKFETEINGKTKKIKWDLDDAVVYGEVNNYQTVSVTVTIDGVSRKYPTASTAQAAETTQAALTELDPFANYELEFSGRAPYAKAKCKSGADSKVTYTLSKDKDISNGDVITVTAELKPSYAEKYVLTVSEKDFTAEELSRYARNLSDISQDDMDKMDNYFRENYASYLTGSRGVVQEMELLGNYMLFSKSSDASDINLLYYVYKVTADLPEHGVKDYYWCAYFEDIVILPDGMASFDYDDAAFGKLDYFVADVFQISSCDSVEKIFDLNVLQKAEKYEYESTVE